MYDGTMLFQDHIYFKKYSIILSFKSSHLKFLYLYYFVAHKFLSYGYSSHIRLYLNLCFYLHLYLICISQLHYSMHNPYYVLGQGKITFTFLLLLTHSLMHKTLKYLLSELINILRSLTLVYLKGIYRSFIHDSSCSFFLYKHYHLSVVLGHLCLFFKRPYLVSHLDILCFN